MRALKIIGIIILVIIALFFLVAAFLPGEVHIAEKKTINAPVETIFSQVNTMANWDGWSPFQDSTMEVSYEGTESGVGAVMSWVSEVQGNGRMEILESEPFSRIHTGLSFMENSKAETSATWLFDEGEEGIDVTWTLDIINMGYPIGRYMALAFPGWMKPVYQKGLEDLKTVCEAMPAMPEGRMSEITMIELPAGMAITISDSVAMEGFHDFFAMAYPALFAYAAESGQAPAGAPYAKYYNWEESKKIWVEAGIPVAAPIPSKDNMIFVELPATKAVMASHFGPYDSVGPTWDAIMNYASENGLESNGAPWESYVNDPEMVETQDIQTDIYWPVK